MKIIKSRLFKALVILFVCGIILGIISYYIIPKNNNIINYYELLDSGKYNYLNNFVYSLTYNYKYSFIIWICGIIFFLILLIPFIIIFRGITVGYTIISIIYSFKLKGLIMSLILLFPCVLVNEIVYLLLSYYSINFSYKIYKAIKYNKNINIKSFSKNYFYIFIISLLLLSISSLFEIYISSNLIKIVI